MEDWMKLLEEDAAPEDEQLSDDEFLDSLKSLMEERPVQTAAPKPRDPEPDAQQEKKPKKEKKQKPEKQKPEKQKPEKQKPEKQKPSKQAPQEEPREKIKEPFGKKLTRFFVKLLLLILETAVLLVVVLYFVMFILAKGPSPTARELFVRSVRETSAVGFLAELYLSEEEIAQIESAGQVPEFQETDTSLITIVDPAQKDAEGPVADEWGLIDEDGDGLILEEIRGEGYRGYMLVVLDPSRVIMGSVPESYGGRGYTVEQMVQRFDAVAGTNAGGFYDPDGEGNGSIPDSLTVYEGEVYYGYLGTDAGFVGLDSNHILHVGDLSVDEIKERDIQYGVSFGPVLISNGEIALAENNIGGLNPRTAIGQRSDGAILMLVVDGRQAISIGATYMDLCEIFLEYGAVNACNLDGGSSTMMWVGDGYVNNCASVIGIRPVPTTFLVLKEGVDANGE